MNRLKPWLIENWHLLFLALSLVATVAVGARWYLQGGSALFERVGSSAGSGIVMVDVAKIVNAQNRVAMTSLTGDKDALLLAQQAGKLVSKTIRDVAGPGTVVILKQAVVAPEEAMLDITDDVLDRLGLPKDTVSVDVIDSGMLKPGPLTNFSGSSAFEILERDREAKAKESRRFLESESQGRDAEVVP